MFRGVDCEGAGPESVVVGALGVAVSYSARLGELVLLGLEFVEEAAVVGFSLWVPCEEKLF